jgi:hypothetical protein
MVGPGLLRADTNSMHTAVKHPANVQAFGSLVLELPTPM